MLGVPQIASYLATGSGFRRYTVACSIPNAYETAINLVLKSSKVFKTFEV